MIAALFNLRRDRNKAPHKPVLLLSLIHEVEEGRITDNKVFITPELLATFKETWSRLAEGNWQCKFFLPFYHMQNDQPKFWFLETEPGASVVLTSSYSPKSVSSLIDAVKYARFADWLWELLTDRVRREKLRKELLEFYFPNKVLSLDEVHRSTQTYLEQLESDFNSNVAADRMPPAYRIIDRESRCALFKSRIPKIYNYTCAISRQRIISMDDSQMIDACLPVSEAGATSARGAAPKTTASKTALPSLPPSTALLTAALSRSTPITPSRYPPPSPKARIRLLI